MQSTSYSAPAAPARPRTGLAIACLVLSLLAVFTSVLLVGALLGALAILLGLVHIVKRRGPNGMAWTGILLALLSLGLSAGMGMLYVKLFQGIQGKIVEVTTTSAKAAEPAAWAGVLAPDFSVTTVSGETIRLSELRGRRVVLNFWATWCPPCRLEVPHFVQLANENSTAELMIIGISSEDEQTLKNFVAKEEVNYPVATAAELPPPFGDIGVVPTTFFLDRNGVIQEVLVGYSDYGQLKELALAKDVEGAPRAAPTVEASGDEAVPEAD